MALITVLQTNFTVVQSLTSQAPVQSSFVAKRGTTPQWGVQFANDDGSVYTYPSGAVITFGAKPPNPNNTIVPGTTAFDGPYIISGSTASDPDDNGIYWLPIGFAGAALDALLGYNPPTINDDVVSVTLAAEVEVVSGSTIMKTVTPMTLIVYHDINTGTEGAVTNALPPWILNWNVITALCGGGATDLDGQPTAGVVVQGTMVALCGIAGVNGGGLTIWQLQQGFNPSGGGYVQPVDYSAVAAALTTASGANADLTLTAVVPGTGGNAITLALVNPEADNAALGVVVTANAIVVNLATGAGGAITSTAAQVIAAINASGAAAALVTAANAAGSDGTGLVTALAATNLAGGAQANMVNWVKLL